MIKSGIKAMTFLEKNKNNDVEIVTDLYIEGETDCVSVSKESIIKLLNEEQKVILLGKISILISELEKI